MEENSQQQVPPKSSVNNTVQPAASSRKNLPLMLCGLVLLLLVGGGAYYMGAKSNQAPMQAELQTTPAPCAAENSENTAATDNPVPTVDATADWKTYTSAKYSLSFKYPATLNSTCCNISGPMTGNPESLIVLGDQKTTQQGTDKAFDGMAVHIVPNQKSLTAYIEEEKSAQLNAKKEFAGSTAPGTQTSTTLNKQQGVILKGYSWDNIERLYVPFLNNQHMLVISKSQYSQGSFEATYDQILSTFTFK